MIIDKLHIIFASDVFSMKCAVSHPKLVQILSSYFDEAWRHATYLKLGNDVFEEEVERVLSMDFPNGE